MSKQEKLLKQARNNLQGLSFDDFKALLSRSQWVEDHQISIQNRNGMAKGYQVKQFLAQLDEEIPNE